MANPDHVEIVKQGAEAIQKWRKEHPLERFDLSGANLSGASLIEADLRGANLSGASLIGADLSRAHVYATSFGHTNLSDVQGLKTCNHDGPSYRLSQKDSWNCGTKENARNTCKHSSYWDKQNSGF